MTTIRVHMPDGEQYNVDVTLEKWELAIYNTYIDFQAGVFTADKFIGKVEHEFQHLCDEDLIDYVENNKDWSELQDRSSLVQRADGKDMEENFRQAEIHVLSD